jgi:hypothetical protein
MLRLFIGLVACSLCSRRELLLEIMAFATTAQCLQGRTLPVKAHCSGQSLLGGVAAVLAEVEARLSLSNRRQSSLWHQIVLDMALAASWLCGQKVCEPRIARTDLPHGCGKSSWGAPRIHGEMSFTAEFSLCNTTCSSMTNIQTIRPEL